MNQLDKKRFNDVLLEVLEEANKKGFTNHDFGVVIPQRDLRRIIESKMYKIT